MRYSKFLAVSVLLIGATSTSFAQEAADIVFTNAKVYTVNEDQPWAEAVAVAGNKIVYVGDAEGVKAYLGDDVEVYDLAGRTILPGFISAHDHFISSNWTIGGVQLFEYDTKEEVLRAIKEYAEANPDLKVIRGVGWSAGKFGGNPLATELDEAVPDRPAIMLDFTIHDAWLNTKAFEAGGVTKDSPDKLEGVSFWERDEDGNPTGVGVEGQWMKTFVDIGAWDADTMIPESINKLFPLAASNGLTAVQNTGIVTPNVTDTHGGMESDFEAALEYLHGLEENGELVLRTFPQPMFKNINADPKRFIDFTVKMRDKYNSDMLRVQSIKIHPEGNWVAEVAPFLEPYESGKTGSFNVRPDTIKDVFVEAAKQNIDGAAHSDSSGTARAVIDGIIAAKEVDPNSRSAIHHATWIHPDDQKKMIENKIPVNATPSFTTDWSNTDKDALRLLGEKRVETMFGKYQDFARAGNSVSIASDVPSTPAVMQAPMYVIEVATTNVQPEDPNSKAFPPNVEPMTIEQAIRSHTIEAAWQMRMEDKIGSLEVGKLADLVVLDRNPLEEDPSDLADVEVIATMMDGRFTYVNSEWLQREDLWGLRPHPRRTVP
ncbi:amidohydrolase family protein [Stappia sp. GBMRC 2046]|uniref:Amidohydrolase family protein n=1 Tax=Stappia sediminis TaxID=2692190 RepID=A0A7X3LRQ8_9HYPH|nr:amidohydrolase family protein [Stappia sediminis]MXN63866.1 amidohydrolase family protein [Stappia sediminis]